MGAKRGIRWNLGKLLILTFQSSPMGLVTWEQKTGKWSNQRVRLGRERGIVTRCSHYNQ